MRRLAALTLVSLAVAGCMGDDEAVSREDYVAEADGICGTYQVRLSRIPRPTSPDPAELGLFLDRALPIAREQNERLAEIDKPTDDEVRAQVEQLLAALDQEIAFNEEARTAAKAGDGDRLNSALQQAGAASAEAGQLAESLGFVVCARRA